MTSPEHSFSTLLGPLPAFVLILLLGFTGAATAQEAGEELEDFFETVNVEIVNVDVWVRDDSGEPVYGLDREDFEVLRNGQSVEISNFYAVEDGRPTGDEAASAAADDSTPGPRVELPQLRTEIAPEHRLWLVLLVDNFNIEPLHRKRTLPAVRRFVGQTLRPGDRAMLATYDRSLKVRQPFTDSPERIYAAMDEMEDDSAWAVIRKREQTDALKRIEKAGHPNTALAYAQQYADEQRQAVESTVDAMQELVESMAGLPGRKVIVHISSGMPLLAGEEMFYAVGEKFDASRAHAEIPRNDTTRAFERLARHANAHRVVFNTLDAAGLRAMTFGAAEYGEFLTPGLRSTLDSVVVENLQSPLRLIARETGGTAILGRNEALEPLLEVATDFRSFYSLGIASTEAEAGRYHRLEVKLKEKRKGVHLRHRQGYRSKSADTRITEQLRSSLLYTHQANPLDLAVDWGSPEPHDADGLYLMPIRLRIPLEHLVLLPISGDRHELRLKLFVGVADERGDLSEIDRAPLGLRLANEHVEAARKESFLHTHKLLLGKGRKKIGIALVDQFGRQTTFVSRYVEVGESPSPG